MQRNTSLIVIILVFATLLTVAAGAQEATPEAATEATAVATLVATPEATGVAPVIIEVPVSGDLSRDTLTLIEIMLVVLGSIFLGGASVTGVVSLIGRDKRYLDTIESLITTSVPRDVLDKVSATSEVVADLSRTLKEVSEVMRQVTDGQPNVVRKNAVPASDETESTASSS